MRAVRVGVLATMAVWLGTTPVMVAPSGVAGPGAAPFFTGLADSASFTSVMDARLSAAQHVLDRLIAVRGPRTIDNTLRVYDDLSIAVSAISGPAGVLASVHPDAAMRTAAEGVQQRARALTADVSLNRALYDALVAIDAGHADAETRYYLHAQLRDFRLAGVDRDEPTRARLSQLQRDLNAAVQEFQRNIRDNNRTITVTDRRDLEGLPEDYLARHAPGPDGTITLTTADADVRPLLTFATHEDVRKRMYLEFANIGYPANIAVLDRMVALRDAIAKALGQPNWATVDMLDRMSGDVQTVSTFIDRIVEASGPPAAREYAVLLARKRQDVPDATGVTAWENTYYAERVKRAHYDFDGQSVRPYFAYDRVTQGLFDVTSTLYGVRCRLAQTMPVWHPSVTAYEMLEGDTVIGRFYLDTHPRANKPNNGAFTSIVRSGVAGRQLPEVVLVAAFPGGQPGDPGLLTHDEVTTYFHEFGHLVHGILAGRHAWVGTSQVPERDFLEAPSQLFEEWTWDPATLATFARHSQTHAPIPAALVLKMRRANEFGKAIGVRQQMVFAKLALSLHDRDPASADSTALMRDLTNRYVPFPYVEGTHRQTAFAHLANRNYTASYYTYMWSLVIAKDLFSRFDQQQLLAPGIARRYRDTVLVPGGSRPAADVVKGFLGRPFNADAWTAWLNRDAS